MVDAATGKAGVLRLALSIAVCQSAGLIGTIFTAQSIPEWYSYLEKPSFSPPNWVFGPVWITLYALMGISLNIVWGKGLAGRRERIAAAVFAVQLALNAIWSFLFFGMKNLPLAFGEIIILWIAIAITIVLFYRISRKAGLMLVPYIAWVSIAALLNYSVWMLNL